MGVPHGRAGHHPEMKVDPCWLFSDQSKEVSPIGRQGLGIISGCENVAQMKMTAKLSARPNPSPELRGLVMRPPRLGLKVRSPDARDQSARIWRP
jgi:hypothetical protein